jgi:hypothetical protein
MKKLVAFALAAILALAPASAFAATSEWFWDDPYVSEQEVKVGTRKDWGVTLTVTDKVPTLVNGRYSLPGVKSTGEYNSDKTFESHHKTATVKFSENVVASWWSLRESNFTLTEGAKFIQVKISDEDNFNHANLNYTLDGTYVPKQERVDYVLFDASRLRIVDLEVSADKAATFTLQSWISIESGFEGDIELKASGDSILNDTRPVVIAKAVSPVTVTSKVKDVKIGYQWQAVHDVTITENGAGYLLRDKTFTLAIDDGIYGDNDNIAFAPDFIVKVDTTSNIQIAKPVVQNTDISFNIDRESYGTPATFEFSNMYVKIDRTVPESNKQPYMVVAGGTAVAANFYGNVGLTTIPTYTAVFGTKGIGADYLNVVTSANDKDSILSNVVRVTIGDPVVRIGRDGESSTIEMDTAAYISPTSESTMVPVRFVSQALGIPDNQIVWDNENRTVTIYNGARVIQFKIGSTDITINGVTTTMYSPANPPIKVSAEITDDRSFLPFRQLGNALGVDVSWDADTNTAIYNAGLLNTTVVDTETVTE